LSEPVTRWQAGRATGFLRALYANVACMGVPTRVAMRLMLLVLVRTSELIETPWAEIDLEKGRAGHSLEADEA
jgi:hypothetical protein